MTDPRVVAFVRKYFYNPVGFVYEVLGAIPDEWQALVMEDVANGERRISIRSGHGIGKSTVLAWLLIWFILTRIPSKGAVTAPTYGQLFDALYAETKSWAKRLPGWLSVLLDIKSDRIELKSAPEDAFVTVRTSRAEQPEAIQGIHAKNVMLIVDEASGVPEAVYEAGQGSMSGGDKEGEMAVTILAGNPTKASGYFYETHTKHAHRWKTYKVSCLDSPRASAAYIEEIKEKYGEDSNVYRVRVLGEFPLAEDNTVLAIGLLQDAAQREIEVDPKVQAVWGLDVARFGDDSSVLTKRRGGYFYPQQSWRKLDLMQLTGAVKHEWDVTPPPDRPRLILVDVIGIGSGVVDRLRELGLPVRGVNVAEAPAVKGDRYRNLRAELWFRVKAWQDARAGVLPNDPELINQLASVRYHFSSTGKVQVESKADMRKRGLASPDKADSLVLTFADEAAVGIHGSKGFSWNKPLKRNLPVV